MVNLDEIHGLEEGVQPDLVHSIHHPVEVKQPFKTQKQHTGLVDILLDIVWDVLKNCNSLRDSLFGSNPCAPQPRRFLQTTFHVRVGDQETVTYIARTEEERNAWIKAFHTLISRQIDKYKLKYVYSTHTYPSAPAVCHVQCLFDSL